MSKHQLLDSQVGFYYGTKIGDDKSGYNIAEYVEINHTLDIARMKRAIHRVISQTPTLHVCLMKITARLINIPSPPTSQ